MFTTKTAPSTETYPVTLDPTVSIERQIRQGNYGFVNPHVPAEKFKLTLTGKREVILYDPKGFASSERMIARMKVDRCVPATFDDCLAFGATFPERQHTNPIVFLGTAFLDPRGYARVPVLTVSRGNRGLSLIWFVSRWFDICRFAAVSNL